MKDITTRLVDTTKTGMLLKLLVAGKLPTEMFLTHRKYIVCHDKFLF
jgi:hypothetical protein